MENENRNSMEELEQLQPQPEESETAETPEEVSKAAPEESEEIISDEVSEAAADETTGESQAEEPSAPAASEPAEAPQESDNPPTEAVQESDTPEAEAVQRDIVNKRRRSHRSSLRFWGTLFVFVLCILILLICVMTPLRSWLEQYEESRPEYVRDEIYAHLFEDPDWDLLYDLAGVECTIFEGKEAFIDYMDQMVGEQTLICHETSAGLSGDRKYVLTCGGQKIATFSIESDGEQFPSWELSDVEVFFTPSESVTVIKAPDYTVYINGIPLDDSYTTMSTETVAEGFLPGGVHGYRMEQQQINGLLFTPEVVVLDAYNNPLPVFYSPETDIYYTEIPTSPEMTEAESALILEAAKAHAQFAIRAITTSELRHFFDPNSKVYAELCDTAAIRKSYKSYSFDEDSVSITDFYRYSDDLFSVRVKLAMNVKVKKKEEFTHVIDTTYFFTKTGNGHYMVTDRTDVDLNQQISMYHLTFLCDDEVVETLRVPVDAVSINAPTTVAEGGATVKTWYKLRSDGVQIPVLELQDDGTYFLALGQTLEPITLYPIFQESAEQE